MDPHLIYKQNLSFDNFFVKYSKTAVLNTKN